MKNLKTKTIALAFLVLAAATFMACESAGNAPKAAITMEQARKTASDAAPGGAFKDGEYEKEGEQWVYSFEFTVADGIREVWVDPQSGKVIKNELEKK